jgi:ABC-2 type transport system ATP-binding protein
VADNTVISIKNVNKTFHIREGGPKTLREAVIGVFSTKSRSKEIKALQNINLNIGKGEIFGIVGRNGSGKSTLGHIMMGSMKPDKGGEVYTEGKMIRLTLGLGVDANLSARDNIYVNASILGLSFKKIGRIFDDIIGFANLEDFVDTPVRFFSKGMRDRLLFSIAMYVEADIILLDEFFGGTGDLDFKDKSDLAFEQRIMEGRTLVIISHNMDTLLKYCQRVIWLHKGEIMETGDPESIIKRYEGSFKKSRKYSRKKNV